MKTFMSRFALQLVPLLALIACQPATADPPPSSATYASTSTVRLSYPKAIRRARQSVVRVVAFKINDDKSFSHVVIGSGAIISGNVVVTCDHVVEGAVQNGLEIALLPEPDAGGKIEETRATIVRRDPAHDLALLTAPIIAGRPALTLAEPSEIIDGVDALVMGFPLSRGELTSTRAMLAGVQPQPLVESGPVVNLLKLDATVNKGNSGGPLISVETGHILGIVNAKIGGLERSLQALSRAKFNGSISIAGVDPVAALQVTLRDMEANLQLGLGLAVDVRDLRALLADAQAARVPPAGDAGARTAP